MLTDEQRENLIQDALRARQLAYAPYSNYPVGAALLTSTGQVFLGANVENAAFPTTMCAERVAVFNAVVAGERQFTVLVVATRNGGSPCGSCRQVLAEFGLDTWVIVVDETGKINLQSSVGELLPGAFRPVDLLGQ